MQTVLQELKDWANQYKGQMISADQVVLQAHKLLEKEKEQIIDAHFNGMDKLATSLSEFLPIKHTMSVIQEIKNGGDIHEDGEQYYNETYKPETI
jgi:dihydropteroate synthase